MRKSGFLGLIPEHKQPMGSTIKGDESGRVSAKSEAKRNELAKMDWSTNSITDLSDRKKEEEERYSTKEWPLQRRPLLLGTREGENPKSGGKYSDEENAKIKRDDESERGEKGKSRKALRIFQSRRRYTRGRVPEGYENIS